VLAVELNASRPDKAEGTLILPFGLSFERPITLHVDDAGEGAPLRVRTCLPVGCLIGLSLDSTAVGLLKKGSALTIRATADGGQPLASRFSLKGFSDAFERTVTLAK
jgi:invasion protein IalB